MSWEVGSLLQALEKPPITREQLKDYAHASGDMNPIHLDEKFAREAGFPSVIVHGMLSMAFLGDLVSYNFPESEWELVRFRARFRKVTFPGDVIRCEGKVNKITPEGGLILGVSARNQKGETTTDGEAEIRHR